MHTLTSFIFIRGQLNQATLRAYFEHFDFMGLRLDFAFRKLCEKLYLKAETQQVDRIIATFSGKYLSDNPENIFGTQGEIHLFRPKAMALIHS